MLGLALTPWLARAADLEAPRGSRLAVHQDRPPSDGTPAATETPVDDYSGTKQPGPGAAAGQTVTPTPSPPGRTVIDAVQGDRVTGPAGATPAARPVVIERDRGVDWTVPLLLAAAALTLLGLGAVTTAVRSR